VPDAAGAASVPVGKVVLHLAGQVSELPLRAMPVLSAGLLGDIFHVDMAGMGQGIRNFLADIGQAGEWVAAASPETARPVAWAVTGVLVAAFMAPWLHARLRRRAGTEEIDRTARDSVWVHLPHLADLPAGDPS
jgi:hypothetical protein